MNQPTKVLNNLIGPNNGFSKMSSTTMNTGKRV